MQPVGADQQGAGQLHLHAVPLHEGHHATSALAVAGDAQAGEHGAGTETFDDGPVQQHLQLSRGDCTAAIPIASQQPSRFGIDVVAVQADERPLPGLYTDRVEHFGSHAES